MRRRGQRETFLGIDPDGAPPDARYMGVDFEFLIRLPQRR